MPRDGYESSLRMLSSLSPDSSSRFLQSISGPWTRSPLVSLKLEKTSWSRRKRRAVFFSTFLLLVAVNDPCGFCAYRLGPPSSASSGISPERSTSGSSSELAETPRRSKYGPTQTTQATTTLAAQRQDSSSSSEGFRARSAHSGSELGQAMVPV
jgi:hypothetical protein